VKISKPYLLVGQGIAGTVLAHHFLQANIPFQIWDSPKHFNSSYAAGGIFNPVTGRKLEKTWLADELFTYLFPFYQQLEITLGATFFYPMPLFRPFANSDMKQWLQERKSEINHDFLDWSDDGVWVKQAGWVDVASLLNHSKIYFEKRGIYAAKTFQEADAQDFEAVIYCEGFHATQNPLWTKLPFLPAKGELIRFQSEEPSRDCILNKNGFILPLPDAAFKVGATYRWNEFTQTPTESSREELQTKLASMGVSNYELLDTYVGVRPATQDRRPFVGMLSGDKRGIFNGFGSKGVSLSPFFAKAFLQAILGEKELPTDVSIRRYSHLFSV
jgi:glycine/D-amino acid oxidase-like deaminating enzyme